MSEDDEVGYGRPPKAHRFRKGQSGNPRGRPRGAKSAKAYLAEELGRKVTVKIQGRTVRLSKLQAIVVQLANRAMSGDQKALRTILEMGSDQGMGEAKELSGPDREIFNSFVARVRAGDAEGT